MDFNVVTEFENKIAEFFGAKYAVSVDSCTHGVELCLRYTRATKIRVPKRTYLSIPFLASKLNIKLYWKDENWEDYYYLTDRVIDAAVLWKKDSYIDGTLMNLSFQYKKHLNLGRGGMILTDDETAAIILKKMSYDGRLPNIPWRDQNIDQIGYHYYMTPETAQLGLDKFENAKNTTPTKWNVTDWPDLTTMDVFKNTVLPDTYIYESTSDPNVVKRRKFGDNEHIEYCTIKNIDPYLSTR
jgi:dTDP-4-amino-4,6-dideoxygalactose transaminase